jgi:plasmid stability protein
MGTKSASMTVRGIDEETSSALKEKARRDGISINALTLRIIREGLGLERKKERQCMMTLTILPAPGLMMTLPISKRQHPFSKSWIKISGSE